LTCRVGKADRLPAVFVSSSAVECTLPALKSGNITITADGGVGSVTIQVLETSQFISSVSPSHGCSDRSSVVKVLPSRDFLSFNFTLIQLESSNGVVFACAPSNFEAFACKYDLSSYVNIQKSFLTFTVSRFSVIFRSQPTRVLFEFHACPIIIDAKPRLVDHNVIVTITGSNFRISALYSVLCRVPSERRPV